VELQDRLRRVGGEPLRRDDVLAGVVALGRAGPEEQPVVKSYVAAPEGVWLANLLSGPSTRAMY
jgi:hypothetical protein